MSCNQIDIHVWICLSPCYVHYFMVLMFIVRFLINLELILWHSIKKEIAFYFPNSKHFQYYLINNLYFSYWFYYKLNYILQTSAFFPISCFSVFIYWLHYLVSYVIHYNTVIEKSLSVIPLFQNIFALLWTWIIPHYRIILPSSKKFLLRY